MRGSRSHRGAEGSEVQPGLPQTERGARGEWVFGGQGVVLVVHEKKPNYFQIARLRCACVFVVLAPSIFRGWWSLRQDCLNRCP